MFIIQSLLSFTPCTLCMPTLYHIGKEGEGMTPQFLANVLQQKIKIL